MALFTCQRAHLWTLLLLFLYILSRETGTQASSGGCSNSTSPLGMASNDKIPDHDITASSELNSSSVASNARLQNNKAWVAETNDKYPWIQVNFQEKMNITALATQGFPGLGCILSFYLSYGDDGNNWLNYSSHEGKVEVFPANVNDNETKPATVFVRPSVTAQYIRVHPTNCSSHCALRMELYGCKSGLPGQPSSPTEKSVSSSKITITWNAPAEIGDGITGYNVKYQEINGTSGEMQKVVLPGSAISTTINVDPYTSYYIFVQAFTDKGTGPWSAPLRVRSSESVPSVAPGNFKLSSSSSLSLDVSWDAIPVKQRQGILLGYRVYYRKENGTERNEAVEPNQLSYKITGLEFASYSVKVAGYTAVGEGVFTASLTKVPNDGAPSPPRNLQLSVNSSKSIKVSWKAPLNMNGNLKRYVVVYGTALDTMNVRVYTSQTMYMLSPLEEFTVYYVQVFAETSVSGNQSNIVQAKTFEDKPSSAPVIIEGETKAEDAHTITVKWQKIKQQDQNGVILGYIVAYNIKDQSAVFYQNTSKTIISTTITGLKPYTQYCIRIQGFTKIGPSPQGHCFDVTTLQKGPSEPLDVVVQAVSSVSIHVKWKKPTHLNGIIQKYIISYGTSKDNQPSTKEVTNVTFERTLISLKKFTTYYIKVRGKTTEIGNASEVLNATTFEDRPGPPTRFSGEVISDMDVLLSWEHPKNANGIIRSYHIRAYVTKAWQDPKEITTQEGQRTQMISNLKPYTNYTFTIQAKTIKLGEMANFTAKTQEGVPSQPTDVKAKLDDDGNIDVSWEEPVDPNGKLTKFKVYCEGTRQYNSSFQAKLELVESQTSRYTSVAKNMLTPGTKYTVHVTAFTVKGEGDRSDLATVNTPAEAPPSPVPPRVVDGDVTPNTITITLTTSSDKYGEVVAHEVVVEKLGRVSKRSTESLPDDIFGYNEAKANGDRFYIAARFERNKQQVPKEFVLGDGKTYGGFVNAPLEPETEYKAYLRAATDVNGKWIYGEPAAISLPPTGEEPTISTGNDNVGIIAGILGALVLIVIVIIAVLLYKRTNRPPNANLDVENQKRKRREFELKRSSTVRKVLAVPGEFINDADHPPILVDQFAKHVIKLHKSDDRGYMIEYNKLDSGQEYAITAGQLNENKAKNRYANIIAYDHSRVVLSAVDGIVGSDYINASRVDGYNKPNAYIASQGPVPPTFDDFWRMVWEQQSSSIVMLTNLQERHKLKCHKYWPDETQDYGDISVMLVKQEHYSDYIIRTFNVKRESEKEEREVKQFHFTVWPDHGVPEYPTALLAFRRRVRRYNPADAGPIIVHCSAGVGRTGTFMVIDSMLDRIKAENSIDIYNFVAYLRTRRTAMVQTEEQYTFCHDAILEAVQCGNTQIYAHDLRITLSRMDDVTKENKVSSFEAEFKRLNKVSPVLNKGSYFVASYPENKEKNRSPDILASDFHRVVLTAIDDNEVTSYINAVHIPGYKQQSAFIVTQHPLTPTVTDFWRMLCEQECSCVVLFDSSEEDGDFPLFWPEEESTYDDMITVQRLHPSATNSSVDNLKADYDQSEINEKTFKATDLRTPEKSLRIKMFQYSGWINEKEVPPCSGLITLIAKVEKWQQHSGNGPITVVCSDGLGRSGTFCALYSVLERLKIEQVVDVFQAIKAMRIARPGLVKTAAEYRFIHYAILDYLAAFDDYANFKP